MTLCDKHSAQVNKWLDSRKPMVMGIRFASGNLNHTVPTHVRTHEIVKESIAQIKDFCARGRNCSDDRDQTS